jgi:hypothetical protein
VQEVRACIDLVRSLKPQRLIARWRAVTPFMGTHSSFFNLGLEQALARLDADDTSGVLTWRLDRIERHCLFALEREREHYARGLALLRRGG